MHVHVYMYNLPFLCMKSNLLRIRLFKYLFLGLHVLLIDRIFLLVIVYFILKLCSYRWSLAILLILICTILVHVKIHVYFKTCYTNCHMKGKLKVELALTIIIVFIFSPMQRRCILWVRINVFTAKQTVIAKIYIHHLIFSAVIAVLCLLLPALFIFICITYL